MNNVNKKALYKSVLLFLIILSLLVIPSANGSKDLTASIAQLPGLADSPTKGAFIDLVKAIDDVYTDGRIKIEVYPFARSVKNVISGNADFHIPSLRNPVIPESKLPYIFATEKMGSVRFVIYSHIDKPLNKKMIDDAIKKKGNFPYKFEVPAGLEDNFAFTVIPSNDIEKSFQKVNSKRIDALLWAQEESDLTLKKMKIKNIHREFWIEFDDVIILPKGPEGEKTNEIISDALKKLRKSGRLDKLYSKIHLPYQDWQPSKMGW